MQSAEVALEIYKATRRKFIAAGEAVFGLGFSAWPNTTS
jgi:hypothetical protein